MYPFIRMTKEIWRVRRLPALDLFEKHEAVMRIYPWDLDIFLELNNGRTLTLFDVPRVGLAVRVGLWALIKKQGYGLTVAGVAMQYRKRVTLFQKLRITAQCVGLDERFIYIVQTSYRGDEPCNQALLRMALVKNGILNPAEELSKEFGRDSFPKIPDWVKNYVDAANNRPWPPKEN